MSKVNASRKVNRKEGGGSIHVKGEEGCIHVKGE